MSRQWREERIAEDGGERAAAPPATAAPHLSVVLALQRTAGNRFVSGILARELPKPGEQPAHREAFDAYVAATWASDKFEDLRAARKATDRAMGADQETLTYGGRQLVVDQENLTAVMTRIRWKAIDIVHDRYTAAHDAEAGLTDEAERRKARMGVLPVVKPYIEFLRDDPILDRQSAMDRFQHWFAPRQESVLSVLGLMAVADAEGAMQGQFAGGENASTERAKSYAATGLGVGKEWCGAFADMSNMHAGLQTFLKSYTHGTGTYTNLFTYATVAEKIPPHWAWTGTEWLTVKDFHLARNAPRTWTLGTGKKPWELDLRPGDIVLVDNKTGGADDFGPDHVQMVQSFHPDPAAKTARLFTIGGNEDSHVLDDSHAPATDEEKAAGHGLRTSGTSFSHVGVGERDLTKDPASAEQKGAVGKNKSRVFAFGRFSIVDYEEHYYVSQFAKPTKPPAS